MYTKQKVFKIKKEGAALEVLRKIYNHTYYGYFVEHYVNPYSFYDENDDIVINDEFTDLDSWLLGNGAHEGEYVLIKDDAY